MNMVRLLSPYSQGELANVPQGVYEYQYSDNSAQQSTATLNNQGYKSSNTPRYAPSPDTPYEGSAYGTSPGIPGYTTIDDTIAGFGNMTLKKGKDREAGIFTFTIGTFNKSQLIIARILGLGFEFKLSAIFFCSSRPYR
jgi:hypothetical protein